MQTNKLIPIIILALLLISGCDEFNDFDVNDFDVNDYNIDCLDKFAFDFCEEKGYSIGHAERTSFGSGLNYHLFTKEAYIECSKEICDSDRDIICIEETKKFRYLQEELNECKPK